MQFHPCGKACPATCDDPDPVCTKQCQPGCRCVEPLVQNEVSYSRPKVDFGRLLIEV